MSAEHLVIVGKGGVGKSTTAANLSAALVEAGKKVVLIGYDANWNSTLTLRGDNNLLQPLPGWYADSPAPLYARGFRDALCVEAGALTLEGDEERASDIPRHPLLSGYNPDYFVHDLSGEPGADFRLPATCEGVPRVLVVTSADMGALHVVNAWFIWLNTIAAANCRFGGIVVNNLSGPFYESIVSDFASQAGIQVSANISRSLMITVSDIHSQTMLEAAPLSHVSFAYRKLARGVIDSHEVRRPKYLGAEALKSWGQKWGDVIAELETGVVQGGSGI